MINQKRVIKQEVLNNITSDVKRQVFKAQTMPPNGGSWKNEYSHKCAISSLPDHADKLFVVGVVDEYHNQSLEDSNWVVYTYDMDGNYIERTNGKALGGKFFMTLTYLQ
jgi:hypothetical protein